MESYVEYINIDYQYSCIFQKWDDKFIDKDIWVGLISVDKIYVKFNCYYGEVLELGCGTGRVL